MRKALLFFLCMMMGGAFMAVRAQTEGDPTIQTVRQPLSLRDQHRQNNREFEVGFRLGNSYGLHDISGDPTRSFRLFIWDTNWDIVNMHYGVFGRFRINDRLGLNLGLNYGKISGSYVFYEPSTPQYSLGYSFQNHLVELALCQEVFLPRMIDQLAFDTYGYIGAAVYYHDPMPGSQGIVPKLNNGPDFGFAVPMGVGFFYTFPWHLRLGGSLGWRKTFTDYLDGYQSGKGMDSYFFISMNVSYLIQSQKNRHFLYD